MQRVKVVVEASQVAWSVLGMVEMLTVSAEGNNSVAAIAED
jgi:U3 small nucleolar RNA-associated protein 15